MLWAKIMFRGGLQMGQLDGLDYFYQSAGLRAGLGPI